MITMSRLLKSCAIPAGKLADRLQLLHLEQFGLRLDARRRLGLDPTVQISIDEFQLGVCLAKFGSPFRYPLIQNLIGGLQFLVRRLQLFGEHGCFFERRPQLACRALMLPRIGDQPGDLCGLLSAEPCDLTSKPILFAGQRSNFRVRVFQRDMRLLEFLSQSRNRVAEGLFWAIRPDPSGVYPPEAGWRLVARLQSNECNQGLHVPVISTFPVRN